MRVARWARSLALSALAVLLVAAALELGLRVLAPQTGPLEGLFRDDPRVGLRHLPGFRGRMRVEGRDIAIRINSRGLRGPEVAAREGRYRVLGLGDSFTFGFAVAEEDTYLSRLQRLAGPGVDVVNAGHCGFGPDNEALLLEAEGVAWKPDLVLVGFYVGNDLWNVLSGPDRAFARDGLLLSRPGVVERWYRPLQPGRIVPVALSSTSSAAAPGTPAALRRRSHLYRFLSRRVAELRARWRTAGSPGTRPLTALDEEAVFIRDDPPEFVEGWSRTEVLLADMDAWCGRHGCRFAVAVIPSAVQVEPERWEGALRRYGLSGEVFDLEKPQRVLREFGARSGVRVIDLLPSLRAAAAGGGGSLYFPDDPHWTSRGHQAAADTLFTELRAAGLLP